MRSQLVAKVLPGMDTPKTRASAQGSRSAAAKRLGLVAVLLALLAWGIAGLAPAAGQVPQGIFDLLDRNRDGRLSPEELPPAVQKRFPILDRNKDGFLDQAEVEQIRAALPPASQRPRVPANVEAHWDIPYAGTDEPRQTLDLLLPKTREGKLPVIVAIHGGGWIGGDKRGVIGRVASLVASGKYAGVSVGYRLSNQASWPAQIHDCKAAIRWIRGNAEKYSLDPERIGVIGWSAGGHLAAMLGTTGDTTELDGELGQWRDQPTRVQCVVDVFGPSDLRIIRDEAGDGPGRPGALVERLLGGPVAERLDLARSASPIAFVSKEDPPFLIIHGTEDNVVPYRQSVRLRDRLREVGVPVALITVEGAGHGNFRNPKIEEIISQFFATYLLGEKHEFTDLTLPNAPSG
ncbi:MAG: alpha/beta fold hydrolase [Thermoguttaceae bacterium]|nr:alpha/beta fold hydrolase [Thermoguttaceae bacterium]